MDTCTGFSSDTQARAMTSIMKNYSPGTVTGMRSRRWHSRACRLDAYEQGKLVSSYLKRERSYSEKGFIK
jgi:hypothetical protein